MQRLLAEGLLRQVDDETVILPRMVGQVLRGDEPGPVSLVEPTPTTSTTTAADADAAAAGAVIDLMRETDLLLETLSDTPVPELRSGGLGVREVKRLTKLTGIDEQRLGLILELSAAAGLIAVGLPRPEPLDGDGPYWAPTVQADRFTDSPTAERWHLLVTTWLDLPSRPSLAGRRGPDNKPIAALSDALFSTAAPLDRRLLLNVLAELPAGAGLDAAEASRMLLWRRPRWSMRLQPGPVADLLDEATALGLVGRGALSTPARKLVAGAPGDEAVGAMNRVLPEAIDHFLLQADLTVVVPGPLNRDLSDRLAEVATVESAGAAMVYRISEATIRRALDIGRTASALHAFFQKHSKTPVPQGLTYLDRRRRTSSRAAAGGDCGVVRALRRHRAAGAGGRGATRRSAADAAAGADGRGVAGADRRCARGAARGGFCPCGRGCHRRDRRPSFARRADHRCATPQVVPRHRPTHHPDARGDRRDAAQGRHDPTGNARRRRDRRVAVTAGRTRSNRRW